MTDENNASNVDARIEKLTEMLESMSAKNRELSEQIGKLTDANAELIAKLDKPATTKSEIEMAAESLFNEALEGLIDGGDI